MSDNTKTPPNQDQRQRTAQQGDANKPQKQPGSETVGNQDRTRQNQGQGTQQNPNKIAPDRARQDPNPNKMAPDKARVNQDQTLDEDEGMATQRTQRTNRDDVK